MYFDGISLLENSKKRLGFFMKIEEVQLAIFLFFAKTITPELFIDIGSNVGFYSLVFKKYYPDANTLAFEPTPDTFKELQLNFSLNPDLQAGIKLLNLGVSSRRAEIDFIDFGDMSGRNAIENTSIHSKPESVKTIKVNTTLLDDFMGEAHGTCLLKIDTEGHEIEVLRGGEGFLSSHNCVLQIEEGYANSSALISDIMQSYGYRKLLHIGPDSYYSNIPKLFDSPVMLGLVEAALNFLVEHRWNKNPAI
jgi:FkbM family methyltransferase